MDVNELRVVTVQIITSVSEVDDLTKAVAAMLKDGYTLTVEPLTIMMRGDNGRE